MRRASLRCACCDGRCHDKGEAVVLAGAAALQQDRRIRGRHGMVRHHASWADPDDGEHLRASWAAPDDGEHFRAWQDHCASIRLYGSWAVLYAWTGPDGSGRLCAAAYSYGWKVPAVWACFCARPDPGCRGRSCG